MLMTMILSSARKEQLETFWIKEVEEYKLDLSMSKKSDDKK